MTETRSTAAGAPAPYMVADLERLLARRSALALPWPLVARLRALLLPDSAIEEALGAIWSFSDWTGIWTRCGQHWVQQSRRDDAEGRWRQGAIARRHAAMCYLAADLAAPADERAGMMLRSTAAEFFAQALPYLYQHAERLELPWRDRSVPAYLRFPAATAPGVPSPLLVAIGSSSTSKEETLILASPFVDAGWAVAALDWPGTGELSAMRLDGCAEGAIIAALRELRRHPRLDPTTIALLGFGLGATPAIRVAAADPGVGGVIAITPPFDPGRWPQIPGALAASPFDACDDARQRAQMQASFSLAEPISRLETPLLVFGAGLDRAAPPSEAERVACAAGEWATLVWYPEAGHLLWEAGDDWPEIATTWLAALFAPQQRQTPPSQSAISPAPGLRERPPAAPSFAVAPAAPPPWAGLQAGEVGDGAFDDDDWADGVAWHGPAGSPPRSRPSD